MNNADLKAFMTEYGPKVVCIVCDNSMHIFLNYDQFPYRIEEIEYKTVGSTDMFGVSRYETWKDRNRANFGEKVKITEWHLTECIQNIVVSDDPKFSPDPMLIK